MKCNICGTKNQAYCSERIMGKYNIEYYHCSNCDFVQTEEPYWLEEAYSKSINLSDTGYLARNLSYANRLTILLYLLFGKNGTYLDYAGGYGVFVRLMRDIGFDFSWDDKYTKNMFASGFEWNQQSRVDSVTLFEAFEHFVEPMSEIENLLKISDTIIFSTDLHPDPLPMPKDWWYFGLDHGQHISFYSKKTFGFIAQEFELNYYNVGSLHILTKKTIPIWRFMVTRLSRFGLHKILAKRLDSKTWADHNLTIKKVK
jgi:hypothetical protein